MNTKLTLTIEQSIIERAKVYAKEKGRSLSDLIENYLRSVTGDYEPPAEEITPLVKAMKGSFKAPDGFDYKKELVKGLAKKHLS